MVARNEEDADSSHAYGAAGADIVAFIASEDASWGQGKTCALIADSASNAFQGMNNLILAPYFLEVE